MTWPQSNSPRGILALVIFLSFSQHASGFGCVGGVVGCTGGFKKIHPSSGLRLPAAPSSAKLWAVEPKSVSTDADVRLRHKSVDEEAETVLAVVPDGIVDDVASQRLRAIVFLAGASFTVITLLGASPALASSGMCSLDDGDTAFML